MRQHRIRNVAMVGLLAAAALTLSPLAAHADGWLTVTATGEGLSNPAANANAQTNARIKLVSQAGQSGQMCTSITSSADIQWYDPYREYFVFSGTATGYCAVTPPYTHYHAATRQYSASTSQTAYGTANQLARNDVLAAGTDCTNWLDGSKLVYAAPAGNWFTYEFTWTALCTT